MMTSKIQRRRSARACDQCRRRKMRCDGELGCAACRNIGLECSFGHPLKQSKGPAYIAMLEARVKELEERLAMAVAGTLCDSDTTATTRSTSSSTSASISSGIGESRSPEGTCTTTTTTTTTTTSPGISGNNNNNNNNNNNKAFGLDVLRRLCAPRLIMSRSMSSSLFDALDCSEQALMPSPLHSRRSLPDQAETMRLAEVVCAEALRLWPFLSPGHIDQAILKVYDSGSPITGQRSSGGGDDEDDDDDDLGLLFAVLALGRRFDVATDRSSTSHDGDDDDGDAANADDNQGRRYFATARELVPLANCGRSLTTLQAALCCTLYLQAASAPTMAHEYICAVSNAAIDLDLDKPAHGLSEDEYAWRQRMWSSIRILQVYISAMVGVPPPAADIGHHQEKTPAFPRLSSPDGSNAASWKVCEAHAQLVEILRSGLQTLSGGEDEEKGEESNNNKTTSQSEEHAHDYASPSSHSMARVHSRLAAWAAAELASLPLVDDMSRDQLLLLYAFDYVQLLVYSPFLHTLASSGSDPISRSYGETCIDAATHAVRVVELLYSRSQFHEAAGFSMNALTFAAIVLQFTASCSTDDPSLAANAVHVARSANGLLLASFNQNSAAAALSKALLEEGPNSHGYQAPPDPASRPCGGIGGGGGGYGESTDAVPWWTTCDYSQTNEAFSHVSTTSDDRAAPDMTDMEDIPSSAYSTSAAAMAIIDDSFDPKHCLPLSGLQSGLDPTWSEPHFLSTVTWSSCDGK